MRFYEAVAHEAGGDELAARDAIADFIERAGRSHPRYTEALGLLSRVEWGANRAEASVAGMEVLLRALERGQSAVALTPLPPPSRWTDYRTFPSDGFFTAELHRGQEPLPDGGWMTSPTRASRRRCWSAATQPGGSCGPGSTTGRRRPSSMNDPRRPTTQG
jgi:hypothetical protein